VAEPLEERTRFRRVALVGGVLLAIFLIDLVTAGSVHAAVWTLVVALLLAGVWLGMWQAGQMQVGTVVSRASGRRMNAGLTVAVVVAVMVGLSWVLDVERTTLQAGLAVVGVGITAFLLALSMKVLLTLPAPQTE
jgi:amino acid permease